MRTALFLIFSACAGILPAEDAVVWTNSLPAADRVRHTVVRAGAWRISGTAVATNGAPAFAIRTPSGAELWSSGPVAAGASVTFATDVFFHDLLVFSSSGGAGEWHDLAFTRVAGRWPAEVFPAADIAPYVAAPRVRTAPAAGKDAPAGVRLGDWFVRTRRQDACGPFSGVPWCVEVSASVEGSRDGDELTVVCAGHRVTVDVVDGRARATLVAPRPGTWTAAAPRLEPFALILQDARKRLVQRVERKIGFREIAYRDARLCVNGTPVALRFPAAPPVATNVPLRAVLADLRASGVNAVRSGDFGTPPELGDFCDELGFYLVAEAPRELRAGPCNPYADPRFRAKALEELRAFRAAWCNHASVVTLRPGRGPVAYWKAFFPEALDEASFAACAP